MRREEADIYIRDRSAKGFTVVQAVVLAELDGLRIPNPYGDLPLKDNDPTKPNEPYFEHVDYVVETANAHGLCVGMLPTWGDKVNKKWGVGPEIFTAENAFIYGEFLGSAIGTMTSYGSSEVIDPVRTKGKTRFGDRWLKDYGVATSETTL